MTANPKDVQAAGRRLAREAVKRWGHAWFRLSADQQTAEVCRRIVAVLVGMDDETCSHNPALGRLQRLAESALSTVGGEL